MQHLGIRRRVRRRASIYTALAAFNAALPRQARLARQCRRTFVIGNGVTSLKQLRAWCYPQQQRQHWHQTNIYRALAKLNAKRIGWGIYAIP